MLIVSKKKHVSDKDWAEAAQQIRKLFFKMKPEENGIKMKE